MNEKPNVKDIVDNFWEGITFYIDKIFKTAPFDKTDTAIIKGISEFGYIIDYNRKMYYDVRTIGGTCSINETVKIMIPQNNMNNVFILKGVDISTLESNFININKITNSGTINQGGFVVNAQQLNPSINNTLAWKLNKIDNEILLDGVTKFSCSFDPVGKQLIFRGILNEAGDLYQFTCNESGMYYGRLINGVWTLIWNHPI